MGLLTDGQPSRLQEILDTHLFFHLTSKKKREYGEELGRMMIRLTNEFKGTEVDANFEISLKSLDTYQIHRLDW